MIDKLRKVKKRGDFSLPLSPHVNSYPILLKFLNTYKLYLLIIQSNSDYCEMIKPKLVAKRLIKIKVIDNLFFI